MERGIGEVRDNDAEAIATIQTNKKNTIDYGARRNLILADGEVWPVVIMESTATALDQAAAAASTAMIPYNASASPRVLALDQAAAAAASTAMVPYNREKEKKKPIDSSASPRVLALYNNAATVSGSYDKADLVDSDDGYGYGYGYGDDEAQEISDSDDFSLDGGTPTGSNASPLSQEARLLEAMAEIERLKALVKTLEEIIREQEQRLLEAEAPGIDSKTATKTTTKPPLRWTNPSPLHRL